MPEPIRVDPSPGFLRAALHSLYDALWCTAAALGCPWLLYKSLIAPGFAHMLAERVGRSLPALPAPGKTRLLLHGVSVGEIKGAAPLVRAIEAAHPHVEVAISSTTDTGLAVARSLFPGRLVMRFPADVTPIVQRYLARLRPSAVVLVELEIWPNFLRQANRMGIPVAVVNGRITDRSYARYRVFRRLLPQFDRISLFCVQGREYADRFLDLCVDPARIVLTGNLKADGFAGQPRAGGADLARLLGPSNGQLLIVAGSTHAPEELAVVNAWGALAREARLVLVPRHPNRCAELAQELAAAGHRPQLLSALRAGAERPDPARVAIVDTVGELEAIYALSDLAFVGGSLIAHGGQNVLEPAARGVPVVVGPSTENFVQEVGLLARAGALAQVADERGLAEVLARLARDPAERARMGAAGAQAVEAQRGATARTLEALGPLLAGPQAAGASPASVDRVGLVP